MKPKPLDDIVEDCPNCGATWGFEEIERGRCFACGYVEGDNPNYEEDDDDEPPYPDRDPAAKLCRYCRKTIENCICEHVDD